MIDARRIQRREQERQAQRQNIVDAARQIAAVEGWQAVTIRKVADRIGYASPILYQHFENKQALLLELMRQGFALLRNCLTQAAQESEGEAQVVAAAQAYWRFAFEYPDLYQVMHGLGGVPFGTEQTPTEAREAFAALKVAVSAAINGSGVEYPDLDGEVDAFWAMLHGFVALAMAGRIKGGNARAEALVERGARIYLTEWQRKRKDETK
jgi:AcrR family transcriptional regulator